MNREEQREEQIIEASRNQLVKSGLTKIDDVGLRASAKLFFVEGAKWADKTILQEVLEWLKKHTYSIYDRKEHCDFGINFESEEQMLQAFKEHFNISE